MSITCAGDPLKKCLWGILGAQVIDTRQWHLPLKAVWRTLDEVLSFTCAGEPCLKYLWGILGAQVIDRKERHLP